MAAEAVPPGRPAPRVRFQGSGAAIAGLGFAVLFTVGFMLLDHRPGEGADADVLLEYYRGSGGTALIVAGGYLVPFAGICFIWFLAATRHRISQIALKEDALLATVQLAAGILFVAMMFVAAAAAVAAVAAVRVGNGDDAAEFVEQTRTMTVYGEALLMIYAFRVAAVLILVSTARGVRTGLFPRWLVWFGYVAAALLLIVLTYARIVVLVVPVWVAVVSLIILFRRTVERREIA
ncbi:conserved hypothetical protein [Beutenbergia cavernae DSM 12333]|uniref:Integral membrane protein n=1 Tax=Beutenbergia cavernae (strain ATCC BAA-8 / DSM 12333 / CCUG 43141 / JCM 11478 / NBRC 16432 / NCIMB 13614 / HKI 0122) TaxID=471853 RepID=C5BYQ5_BEUC1|nr:hypothetical protein [Beutenbergia cavernae]ACQ79013.1 conserved hypothetical protein [Beutenbergia cavernae DSM 12333]